MEYFPLFPTRVVHMEFSDYLRVRLSYWLPTGTSPASHWSRFPSSWLWSHTWMPERVLAKGNAVPASIREPLSLKWFIPGGLELAPLNCKFMDKTAGWGFRNHTKNGTNSSSLVWVLFPSLTNEGHCGTQFLKAPAAQMMPYPWAAYSKAKNPPKNGFLN